MLNNTPQTANAAATPSNSWCATQQPCSHAGGISRSCRHRDSPAPSAARPRDFDSAKPRKRSGSVTPLAQVDEQDVGSAPAGLVWSTVHRPGVA